jgi:carbon storage regulator
MLVLSRMKDQVIVIGEGAAEIRITLVDVRGDKCRIGISAPKSVRVDRLEVTDAIRAGKPAAQPQAPGAGDCPCGKAMTLIGATWVCANCGRRTNAGDAKAVR